MKRHSFDIISFLFGALFVGAGVSAVLFNGAFSRFDGRWVWPALLVVGGVVFALSTWRPLYKGDATADEVPESPIS
jgi:NO-binding membrane sensor protein with MHYT domain